MAGPAAAALAEADGLDLPAASTEPTGAGWRAGGQVLPGRCRFRRPGALARGRFGIAGGGVAVATARAREAAAGPFVSQWAGLPLRCRVRACVAGQSPMGLSKSKHKLRKGKGPPPRSLHGAAPPPQILLRRVLSDELASGTFSSGEYPRVGKWSDPSLSRYLISFRTKAGD